MEQPIQTTKTRNTHKKMEKYGETISKMYLTQKQKNPAH